MSCHDLTLPILTSGAYVAVGDVLPFVVGLTKDGDRLGVVRLGGHREPGESAWQCAAREAHEEASISITPVRPPITYWLRASDHPSHLHEGPWFADVPEDLWPLLVVMNNQQPTPGLSVMYVAQAQQQPIPSGETHGLLLLQQHDVEAIVTRNLTLGEYLAMGGQAILRSPLPRDLLLAPYLQLRALAELLKRHPQLMIQGDAEGQ